MIERYPQSSELTLQLRPILHPMFQKLPDGISEFTFANVYLFRAAHDYRIAQLDNGLFVITGRDGDVPFFMVPFGLPDRRALDELFARFDTLKCATGSQSRRLTELGCTVTPDRDNFDYLYCRADLATLPGRRFHKKKNRLSAFIRNYEYEGRPLLDEYKPDALAVLDRWLHSRADPGDYAAAAEALEHMDELQLCGGIYYVDSQPVAYTLGEELALGRTFVIHFEKAVDADRYRGLYQFINQAFAAILPDKYDTINRQQDLGDTGLRQAKESYNPVDFIKKFRARQ